jgi:hypothetical protein
METKPSNVVPMKPKAPASSPCKHFSTPNAEGKCPDYERLAAVMPAKSRNR